MFIFEGTTTASSFINYSETRMQNIIAKSDLNIDTIDWLRYSTRSSSSTRPYTPGLSCRIHSQM